MQTYMKYKQIKTIVFDLNGTLTGRVSDHPEHIRYRNAYIEANSGIADFHRLPNSTTSALKACGLSPLRYYLQRNSEIDWNVFHHYNENVHRCLTALREAGFTLVLYTNGLGTQVEKTLEILKLTTMFDLCITEEYDMKKPSPMAFEHIANVFHCEAAEILMVGNDYVVDLLPLLLMGGNGIQVDSESELFHLTDILISDNVLKAS
ncbi:MAG: FMN phosphatase YigB (HAD superfamily) [Crocinitomicaceae bacterium]|jgi:FMN phosphatase YigB (HAD superfamily)